jgi:hypothetical protein
MPYVKNLPAWERVVRLVASLALAACAYRFWGHPAGIVFAALAVYNTATAIFGFCPGCAMAGRRSQSKSGR